MNARILAPVALVLCLALFFAWRTAGTARRIEAPALPAQEQAAPPAPAAQLAPTTRAPVVAEEPASGGSASSRARADCTVHGRVLDQNGAAVSLRDVWLRPADRRTPVMFSHLPEDSDARIARCDAAGHFSFQGVASGTWWIGPSFADASVEPASERIAAYGQVLVIDDSMHEVDVQIRAGRGLYLRGVLYDRREKGARGGLVLARDLESGLATYASVNKAGMFEVGPLRPGRCEVSGWSREGDAPSEPVLAAAGDERLELRMRPGAELSGVIADENGQHVFANLHVVRRGSMAFPSPVLQSLRDGTFRIPGLETGNYDIVATTPQGSIGILGAVYLDSAGRASDLVIAVHPGGTARVRYEGHDPVGRASLIQGGMTLASVELSRGVVQDFMAGRGTVLVRIEMLRSGETLERECAVTAGQPTQVLFEAAKD